MSDRPPFRRRFWRSLTGQRTGAETCRPIAVTGDDGQPIQTMVLGAEPMSDETRAAFAEIVRAAQRKHRQQLHEEREQQARDVLAVRALTNATSRMLGMWADANDDVRRELWTTLHARADVVFDRFRERYAELDAAEVETQTAVHGLLADLGQRAREGREG